MYTNSNATRYKVHVLKTVTTPVLFSTHQWMTFPLSQARPDWTRNVLIKLSTTSKTYEEQSQERSPLRSWRFGVLKAPSTINHTTGMTFSKIKARPGPWKPGSSGPDVIHCTAEKKCPVAVRFLSVRDCAESVILLFVVKFDKHFIWHYKCHRNNPIPSK